MDLSDLGDDFFEIECPSCGEDIVIDESVLDIGEVTCPNCGDRFSHGPGRGARDRRRRR
ncbi:MAG: MJ0042-type zinc finger domain-containing protein [Evtepia sp.]